MANPLSAEQMSQLEGHFATRVATVQAELTALLGARFDQMQAAGAGLQAELDVSRAEKAQLEERLAEAIEEEADWAPPHPRQPQPRQPQNRQDSTVTPL